MPPIQKPVTGREELPNSSEPLAALAQFYRALNSRDIALMEQNWDTSDESVMDNPLGEIKRGWPEIRSVYERLFSSESSYHFEFFDYTIQTFGEIFIAIGRERGQLTPVGSQPIDLAIRTTGIFRSEGGRWRQIHHHGSMDNPEMLERYQQAVLKRAA
jgi:ketosteroid isomerase-like protein